MLVATDDRTPEAGESPKTQSFTFRLEITHKSVIEVNKIGRQQAWDQKFNGMEFLNRKRKHIEYKCR